MSVKKQLCINHIPLPEDLLSVIKDFAFIDIVYHLSKTRKKSINKLIDSSNCTGKCEYKPLYYNYMFVNDYDSKFNAYFMNFCSNCGNYKKSSSKQNPIIKCLC